MEANKRLLGEHIDEIDKKISYINYLNIKYEKIFDAIVELYKENYEIAEEIFEEELDNLQITKNRFFSKNYDEKISIFCKTTESIKKKIEQNLLDNSSKVLDIIYVLEKINEDTNTGIIPSSTDIIPSSIDITPSEEDTIDIDYEDVTDELSYFDFDEEVAEDYKTKQNTTLMNITNTIKTNLGELPTQVKIELLDCYSDMLSPIFNKNKSIEKLERYIKMRGSEVNEKIDFWNTTNKFDSQTGKVDSTYNEQLDKIINLLDFRKDERLNTYIKDLVKEY